LPIIDEVRRALPNIAEDCCNMKKSGQNIIMPNIDSRAILRDAVKDMESYLERALD